MSPSDMQGEGLAPGQPQEGEAVVDGSLESVILVGTAAGARAWLNVCPHAGRRLDWAPGKFLVSREGLLVCAAHGASFDMDSGLCVSGPCKGQSLRAVDIGSCGTDP